MHCQSMDTPCAVLPTACEHAIDDHFHSYAVAMKSSELFMKFKDSLPRLPSPSYFFPILRNVLFLPSTFSISPLAFQRWTTMREVDFTP